MEQILEWDKALLLFINGQNSPFFDNFFWLASSKEAWIPFYLTLLYILTRRAPKMALVFTTTIILTIVLSDQISSTFFKNFFQRLRPSHEPSLEEIVRVLFNYRGGQYGFVSSHAANTIGLATLLALIFKNKALTITLISWAVIVSYSRIYLGVHYPTDVIVGGLVGFLSALLCYKLLLWFLKKSYKINIWLNNKKEVNEIILKEDMEIFIISLISSTLLLLLISKVMCL